MDLAESPSFLATFLQAQLLTRALGRNGAVPMPRATLKGRVSRPNGIPKKNVVWKVEIPGRGHSSPVVEGDLVWLTTAYETPASEEDVKRRLKVNTGGQPLNLLAKVSLRAVQINPETGKNPSGH